MNLDKIKKYVTDEEFNTIWDALIVYKIDCENYLRKNKKYLNKFEKSYAETCEERLKKIKKLLEI